MHMHTHMHTKQKYKCVWLNIVPQNRICRPASEVQEHCQRITDRLSQTTGFYSSRHWSSHVPRLDTHPRTYILTSTQGRNLTSALSTPHKETVSKQQSMASQPCSYKVCTLVGKFCVSFLLANGINGDVQSKAWGSITAPKISDSTKAEPGLWLGPSCLQPH